MNISVVIPAYNEAQNIKVTIEELIAIIKNIQDINDFQIIVVDDNSSDNTFDIVSNMNNPIIYCIRLSRHGGSHIALRAGLQEAKGDATLFISADGQDDPRCLKDMLKKWQNGAKVVWGLRKSRTKEPWYLRKPAQLFYTLLIWLGAAEGAKIDISRGNFFLLDRVVVDAINRCPERNTSLFGLIIWVGFKQDYVEYERNARRFGESKWDFFSLFHLAKDWIIAFSDIPLKIASLLGIIMSIVGMLGAVYVIIDKLFFSNIIAGWTSIVVLVLILGGIQLTILGIIGEYLWRNLDESRKRPLFFIEKMSD